jgi:hypothetical protein
MVQRKARLKKTPRRRDQSVNTLGRKQVYQASFVGIRDIEDNHPDHIGVLCEVPEMKYAFIQCKKLVWPIRVQCPVLRVSVAGYHEHLARRMEIASRYESAC